MIEFPDPRQADSDGLVAYGGVLTPAVLAAAYAKGIFPWPQPGLPLLWFSPDPRGVLDFKDFHVSRSLKKWERNHPNWKYTMNQAFIEVIVACAQQSRPGQQGTWILPEIIQGYEAFFKAGRVLSFEAWEDHRLIGGIYGVLTNTPSGQEVLSGESMFFVKTNASKMCFWKLVEYLKGRGHQWMDIQMVTPITQSFGGRLISRDEFYRRWGLE